ncbi:MAG: DUF5652 family protein [Minisyncoccota bacterium]
MESWINTHPYIFLTLVLWSLAWKGVALWKSAGLKQKPWFIALLLINTFGLLEIFYIFIIARKHEAKIIEE